VAGDEAVTGGCLYGLGVGPGDPELVTLKAARILQACPVVAYPAPDDGESFARSIVADLMPAGVTEIPMVIPMRTERYPAFEVYDAAAGTIGGHLDAGRDVAVLCEGDPFFYGSFMYLFSRLAGRYRIEIVPGVTSLTACAAAFGRPLAGLNDVLSVVPATLSEDQLYNLLQIADAVAIMKVGRHLEKVRRVLDDLGMTAKAAYVERATLPNQKAMPLARLDAREAPYFSMILVYRGGEPWR
jgi:precorrin-2/cobalt-factor-2 C20-methyltransferase